MGTICHKVFQVLALCKLEFQTSGKNEVVIQEEELGEIKVSYLDFLKQSKLTNDEVDAINKTRINKELYNSNYYLKYGHIRYGRDFVNSIIIKVYDHYKSEIDNWQPVDYKSIINFSWMALEYDNGRLDPRLLTIKEVEHKFDIPIDKPWAKYSYIHKSESIDVQFSIKGTIDLLIEEDSNTLIIQDYKSGRRIDWNEGPDVVKTQEKLNVDKQLMLYFYAASHLFPEYKKIKLRIFFIRDGGEFIVEFTKKDILKMEKILKDHITEVKMTEIPALISEDHSDMKCKYLCGYYKNKLPGTSKCICDFIHDETVNKGIGYVIDNYSEDSFKLGHYSEPGSK